jgi:sarcosine oxidase subunit alpha
MRRLVKRSGTGEGRAVHFYFDGQLLPGYEGEPIAAALLANGIRTIRHQLGSGAPRGLYCAIGHCFDCIANVDGVDGVRTCLTPVSDDMAVRSTLS